MGEKLTNFIVIKSIHYTNRCAVRDAASESVVMREESVFSHLVKIQVEPSTTHQGYVHLRFCSSNRYWQKDTDSNIIVAQSTKPVEDISDQSCTLFEQSTFGLGSALYLNHVRTGFRVVADVSGSSNNVPFRLASDAQDNDGLIDFMNWEALVLLPSRVAFKGYNNSYLGGIWAEGHPYLQFASDDPNSEDATYRVYLLGDDGNVHIYSDHFSRYWQFHDEWIWATIQDPGSEENTLFRPVKIDNNTIALRCVKNDKFCRSLDYEGKTRCLAAAASSIINEAKITVQELVSERQIRNVRYRMEDARIYDERPYTAGYATGTNDSAEESQISVSVTYEDSKTYSFSRSTSLTAGVTATIEAGIPLIAESSIEISFEVSEAFEWGKSVTVTKTVTATGSVTVPAKSAARVGYVGTMGICDIPYSYTQWDRSSFSGDINQDDYDDGSYTGVSCYNFDFVITDIKSVQ